MAATRQEKVKVGHPFEVKVSLSPQDAVNILNAVVYGTALSLNGDRARTSSGRAVRLTFQQGE